MDIFSGEERSEICRFFGRFRNSPEWPESKIEAWLDQDFFPNFHHGAGVQVFNLLFQAKNELFTLVSNVRFLSIGLQTPKPVDDTAALLGVLASLNDLSRDNPKWSDWKSKGQELLNSKKSDRTA